MKLTILFLGIPFFIFSQTQIGTNINAENTGTDSSAREGAISLSANGNMIAIGASLNNDNGNYSGKVRVFENISDTWVQLGNSIVGQERDQFGQSVSLSDNGNILAVGASRGNDPGVGVVRVYENISGIWTQIGSDILGEGDDDRFGWSVSLSSNGSIVGVGALRNGGNGSNSGHVRVYENISGVWTQIGNDIDGEASGDQSGRSISLSENGNIIAIGAHLNDGNGNSSGHVRVYENISGVWTQIGSDIDGESSFNNSGSAVSLSANGSIVIIGAPGNSGNGSESGHVRIYENMSGVWTQIGADIDGETSSNLSGSSVAISSDGTIIAVGADFNSDNGYNSGHVRIYKNMGGTWTQIGNDIDGEIGDESGTSVSLSSNGNIVAIGSGNSGIVRIYDLSSLLSLNKFDLSQFTLYPNPSKTHITIAMSKEEQLKKVNIYNNLGQKIIHAETASLDVSKLSSGTYILEVISNKRKMSKKFIKE